MENFITHDQYKKASGIFPQRIGGVVTIKGIKYRMYAITVEGVRTKKIENQKETDLVHENS